MFKKALQTVINDIKEFENKPKNLIVDRVESKLERANTDHLQRLKNASDSLLSRNALRILRGVNSYNKESEELKG